MKFGKFISFVTSFCIISALLSPLTAFADERVTPSGIAYENIADEIEQYQKDENYASFEASVFTADEVLYTGCFGYIDRENEVPADEDTVYEWGSVSKTLVWISVMQLYEQGKIDLNADVKTYLPENFIRKLKYDDPITMMNLMNHNAGWQETTYTIETTKENKIISLADALRNCEPAQVHRPGEVTSYSNWGAALAGFIVERVSGMDYAEYVHKNILEPLGMEHTAVSASYLDNQWVHDKRMDEKAYQIAEAQGRSIDKPLGNAVHYILIYPAGSVTGTIGDITKYGQELAGGCTKLFNNSATYDLMISPSLYYGESDIPRNCHGFWTEIHSADTFGHGGNTVGFSASLMIDPVSKTGTAVLTNQMGETVFCEGIPTLIFGDIESSPHVSGNNITERNDISGMYVNSRSYYRGFTKIIGSLNFLPVTQTDEDMFTAMGIADFTRIGNDVYLFEQDGSRLIVGYDTLDNGSKMLELYVMNYIEDKLIIVKIAFVIIMAVITLIGLVILIVKLIRLIAKKRKKYAGAGAITAGQAAKLVSFAALLICILTVGGMGFSKPLSVIFCIIQMLCIAVYVGSSAFSIKYLNSKDWEKAKNSKYILAIAANVFAFAFAVYFELFNFWSC